MKIMADLLQMVVLFLTQIKEDKMSSLEQVYSISLAIAEVPNNSEPDPITNKTPIKMDVNSKLMNATFKNLFMQ